jgi:predicted HTH domain antitoxin
LANQSAIIHTLSSAYPDDLPITSGQSPADLETELTFLLADKLFELHRLSLGKAAAFCHMGKLQFMHELGRLQIPVINLEDKLCRMALITSITLKVSRKGNCQ